MLLLDPNHPDALAKPYKDRPLDVIVCDGCGSKTPNIRVYKCLECPDCDLCTSCVSRGRTCDTIHSHSWIEREVDPESGRIVTCGKKTISRKVQETMHAYPKLYQPTNPEETLPSSFEKEHRFISKTDPRKILIYTDGACFDNGRSNAQGGWAFVYRPSAYTQTGELTHGGTVCYALEKKGPLGEYYLQTSNRAELRAVIAALQFRNWATDCNESWTSLVLATDSEYAALGATKWIIKWERELWQDVKNQDLWKLLLLEFRMLLAQGVAVSFWRIPREWNERADNSAKQAATNAGDLDFHVLKPDGPVGLLAQRLHNQSI